MKQLIENVKGSKGTSGFGGVILLLGLLGRHPDPALQAEVRMFLTNNLEAISSLVAWGYDNYLIVLAGVGYFFVKVKDANGGKEYVDQVKAGVERALEIMRAENAAGSASTNGEEHAIRRAVARVEEEQKKES